MSETAPRPTYHLARFVFARLVAFTFLLAFLAAWVQIPGLVGDGGLLPVPHMISEATRLLDGSWKRFWIFPTFCWISPSDFSLHLQCALGTAAALAALLGLAPAILLAACWALYLSLAVAGQAFFQYQWDNLLLEAGLLAAVSSPWRLSWFRPSPGTDRVPGRLETGLFLWLLFKLMFLSGLAKLSADDLSWPALTALSYHYWTQPLPNPLSWFFHLLPLPVHKLVAVLMFFSELAVPFLLVLPARFRRWAFVPFITIQIFIAAVGNYGLFNLLVIFLCVWTLEDGAWPRGAREKLLTARVPEAPRREPRARIFLLGTYAVVSVVIGVGILVAQFGWQPFGKPGLWVLKSVYPFRSFNAYGLFTAMPKARSEIVVEGSLDGKTWKEYSFKHKPGDPNRMPGQVAPYMPRLDWQMWFAALGDCERSPFLTQMGASLLTGNKRVTRLLGPDPFGGEKPKAVRFRLFNYRMTDWKERRETGAWWVRDYLRDFCPEIRQP